MKERIDAFKLPYGEEVRELHDKVAVHIPPAEAERIQKEVQREVRIQIRRGQ